MSRTGHPVCRLRPGACAVAKVKAHAAGRSFRSRLATVTSAAIAIHAAPVAAQTSVAEFYKDKTVTVLVGSTAGGGVDVYGRLVGRYIGRHIPGNPKVVVSNMPGAGSMVAARHIYAAAPRDGTQMAIVIPSALTEPLLGATPTPNFEPLKLNFIGNANREVPVCIVRRDAPAPTFAEALKTEIIIGATGPGSTVLEYPVFARNFLGAKFRIVQGYPGTREISLALEKGEVHGVCGLGWSSAKNQYQRALQPDGFAKVLLQEDVAGVPELNAQGAPRVIDFAKTADDKKAVEVFYAQGVIIRPFIMPPGVPPERVRAMRQAFAATMADPELRAEANKQRLDVVPHTGEELEKIIVDIYASPPAVVARIKQAMSESR